MLVQLTETVSQLFTDFSRFKIPVEMHSNFNRWRESFYTFGCGADLLGVEPPRHLNTFFMTVLSTKYHSPRKLMSLPPGSAYQTKNMNRTFWFLVTVFLIFFLFVLKKHFPSMTFGEHFNVWKNFFYYRKIAENFVAHLLCICEKTCYV